MVIRRVPGLIVLLCAAWAAPAARAEFPGFAELKSRAAKAWTGENPSQGAVLVLLPAKSPLEAAAKALAAHRKAEIVAYDPSRPEDLLETLIRKKARWAAVFAEPKDMDVNLVRRFIVLSTLLDDDPFCDVALGFVTGSTPKKTEAFVARMIAADRAGVKPFAIQLCMSNLSQRYEGSTFLPGVPGDAWYVKEGDLAFARKALADLPRAGFVHLGGCADPEGIWMFDDDRNRHAELHWPFDPKRVGEDPKGEMPRLKAGEFRGLDLGGAVVWTHCCHLGSVDRVFVEGDIVSTFGTSEKVEEYRIPAGRSVALAILDAGPSAYVAPLGANFGMQSEVEHAVAAELGLP
ncbi:MAG: hypothetical protein MUC63_08355, partial [Planctomycetes bacterium]|nr:hypothetical protein [Planctomycetota bacterium]